jgi:hypothetical protein
MDPYLESPTHWSDFHSTFIHALRESINHQLPAGYIARIDEQETTTNSVLEPPPGVCAADCAISRGGTNYVVLSDTQFLDRHIERYIRIVRLPSWELVTVLELLSPTRKYGDGRGEYMHRRGQLRQHGVNLVELDLLRAGVRIEFSAPPPPAHYFAFVSRACTPAATEAYPWSVRMRLPSVPLPLVPPDADVTVGLAAPFAVAYERGRSWKLIDYTKPPPPPPFAPTDTEWVAQTARRTRPS